MDDTRRPTVGIHEDLFVVREAMAADRRRAATEHLAHVAGSNRPGSGARAWLGHRLMAAGSMLAGDRPAQRPSTSPDCPS